MKERITLNESGPTIDYLNEDLKITFEIEQLAAEHLPEVSQEENRTLKERFAVLLGTVQIQGPKHAHFVIRGVYEEDDEDRRLGKGTYSAGTEEVEIDVRAIKRDIAALQASNPEYQDFNFIGHIHTHPGIPPEGKIQLQPSVGADGRGDIAAFAWAYEQGELQSSEPFIFAIAAPDHEGTTMYAFYRLIKNPDGSLRHEYLP